MMLIFFFSITFTTMLVSDSSPNDQVHQSPPEMFNTLNSEAEIQCFHNSSYNTILWYKQSNRDMQLLGYIWQRASPAAFQHHHMMALILLTCVLLSLWLRGHCQDVIQIPEVSWTDVTKSAEMNCSHNRDKSYNQMYWYRQRPGETMTLIVFTVFGGKPDYGQSSQSKYSAVKDSIETGALTVKNVQPDDRGLYFCAVSKHSDVRRGNS